MIEKRPSGLYRLTFRFADIEIVEEFYTFIEAENRLKHLQDDYNENE